MMKAEIVSAMRPYSKPLRWLAFQVRWWRWMWGFPGYRLGDPLLGRGTLRDQNRNLIRERYKEKEPTWTP